MLRRILMVLLALAICGLSGVNVWAIWPQVTAGAISGAAPAASLGAGAISLLLCLLLVRGTS